MKRQSFQQGTVVRRERKRGPDIWVFIYREHDGRQVPKRIGTVEKYPTKASAEKAAGKLRKGINERREAVFVSDLLDKFEKEIKPPEDENATAEPTVRVVTADSYKSHIKRIREEWGTTRLDVMAKDMMGVEQWVNGLQTLPTKNTKPRQLAKKSRFNFKALLHRLFERAIFWGMLEMQRNPIGLVEVTGKAGRTRPLVSVTPEVYQKLLNDEELPKHARMMIVLAMCLGLRASEILGLRPEEDFDYGSKTLKVQRSMVGKDQDETKTPESMKVIPLNHELAEEIHGYITAKKLINGWMFGNALTGRPYWRGIMQQDYLKPAGKRAGVEGMGWHSFRHAYRANLAELGEAMEVQQRMMRHTDIKTTMGYGDPKFEKQRRAANDRIFEMVAKKRSA